MGGRRPGNGARTRPPGESAAGDGSSTGRPPSRAPSADDSNRGEPAVKLAVVVQRYGAAINGGAELHARYIAEHLARHADVEVLTTCASDYVSWRNELTPAPRPSTASRCGVSGRASAQSAGLRPALRPRFHRAPFARRRDRLAGRRGPDQPGAHRHIGKHGETTTTASSSATGTTTLPRCAGRALARDPRADGRTRLGNRPSHLPARVPGRPRADVQLARRTRDDSRRRRKPANSRRHRRRRVRRAAESAGGAIPSEAQHPRPFAIYVDGSTRTKAARSCSTSSSVRDGPRTAVARARRQFAAADPDHPRIRHLGFLDDADKFDAMAAADLLIMPSYFESLSMVALEAWALGSPFSPTQMRSAQGPVHTEQCRALQRAGPEFIETLRAIEPTGG